MIDKKFLGNYSSLVWLEGSRQIKESFNHSKGAPFTGKGLLKFYHD
jgi:hypothetical protein